MNHTMKKLAALLMALAMLLSLCVGCGAQEETSQETASAETTETAEEKNITLTVTYADETSEEYAITTTAEFLKEAIETTVELEGSEGEYGYTLTAVNGVEADFADGKNAYWAIYVNDEYGMYSLDTQPVTDGDRYALVYENY